MNFKKMLSAVIMIVMTGAVQAREEINVMWGFNLGSNQANTVRIMLDELNTTQDKYRFLLVGKPGAGGTIAANAVTASPENTVVAMSSSFIIRPYFEKTNPTQNLDTFLPVLVQAEGAPLLLLSSKYKNIQDVIKKTNVTIGVSGFGSLSHLAANELVKLNPTVNIVNFKSMLDAGVASAGEHVHAAISFYIDSRALIDDKKLNILGYTGDQEILGLRGKEFKNNGMPNSARLTANYAVFASRDMTPARLKELHALFSSVNRHPAVVESYKKDQLTPVNFNLVESEIWYSTQRRFWKDLVEQI